MLPGMFGTQMPGSQFMNSYYPFIIAISFGFFFGIRHYFRGPQCTNIGNLKKKVIIVTGGNSGIGAELSKIFCEHGAKVYIGCRNKTKAEAAVKEIKGLLPRARLHFLPLDLASFHSVKAFAAAFLKRESSLDVLVNNAGVLAEPSPQTTADGVDLHFQVNYLGHFLLTHLLLDTLKATPNSRVVNNTSHAYNLVFLQLDGLVPHSYLDGEASFIQSQETSSAADQSEFDKSLEKHGDKEVSKKGDQSEGSNGGAGEGKMDEDAQANLMNRHYAISKLSLVMFTRKMPQVLGKGPPTVLVANPGVAFTDIYRHMTFRKSWMASIIATPFLWYVSKTAKDGAQSCLLCCTCGQLEGKSGAYVVECAEKQPSEAATEQEKIDFLYDVSLKVVHKWLH